MFTDVKCSSNCKGGEVMPEWLYYVDTTIAAIVSILRAYNVWLDTKKKRYEIEKLWLEIQMKRRAGSLVFPFRISIIILKKDGAFNDNRIYNKHADIRGI